VEFKVKMTKKQEAEVKDICPTVSILPEAEGEGASGSDAASCDDDDAPPT
jgi:hypothetical protein